MHSYSLHLKFKLGMACICILVGASAESVDIESAIQRLGSKSYAERESATQSLWTVGQAAQEALNKALKNEDPEIRVRAQFIIERLKLGLRPDSTPEETAYVQQFLYGNSHQRGQIVRELIQKGAKSQDKIPEWIDAVSPDNERASLLGIFGQIALESARLFITQDKDEQTRNLLNLCLKSGHPPVAQHAVAYYALKDELSAKIAELQNSDSSNSKKGLALLYRAAGDAEKARDAAKESGDNRLLRDILFEMNDWNSLADLNDVMKVPVSINDDRLMQMVFNWMAGKSDAFAKDCEWLEEQVKGLPDMDNKVWNAVETYLVTSQIARADKLLRTKKNYLRAMELQFAALDLNGAFELYEKGLEAKPPYLFRHRLAGARMYAAAGEQEKAEEIFNALADEQKSPFSMMYEIIAAESKVGLRSLALSHTAKALAAMKSPHQRSAVFIQLWNGRQMEAEEWWNMLNKIYPTEEPILLLTRMDHLLVAGSVSKDPSMDIREFPVSFEKVRDQNSSRQAVQHYVIGRAFADHAMRAEARNYMETAIKLYPNQNDALLYLAQEASREKDWAAMAGHLSRVQRNTAPHLDYLYGYSLSQSGKAEEGLKLMEKTKLILFGDDFKRGLFITELRRFGLENEARSQENITLGTGQFMSHYVGQVLRSCSEEAIDKGDYKTAARYWERSMVGPIKSQQSYVETSGYLLVPHYVQTYRACHLAKEGKFEEAMERAEMCSKFHPGGIDLAIHLVPLLESAGRKNDADRIFKPMFDRLRSVIKSYPDSPQLRNQAAWMAAKCNRELDAALADATHAVKLRPSSAAYIDTLAEVQFVQGNTDEAIKTIRRAVQLEPAGDYYQKQLTRFMAEKDK